MNKPRLIITMGDFNGVGPDILNKAFAKRGLEDVCEPVVYGDPRLLQSAGVAVEDGGLTVPARSPGKLSGEAGRCAMEWLRLAVEAVLREDAAGVVTCPINKEGIQLAGYTDMGHTDAIARMVGAEDYRMCLFSDRMRIVHLTGHLPLAEALRAVVGSSRVDLQACKLEYSIVSPK